MSVINEVGLLEFVGAALIRNIFQVRIVKIRQSYKTKILAPSPSIYSFELLRDFTKTKEERITIV